MKWPLSLAVNATVIIFEFIGVGIIIYSGLASFLKFLRHFPDIKMYLVKSPAMEPGFKVGNEILHTMMVHEWREIEIMIGITALRVAPTFLTHWETREEERTE